MKYQYHKERCVTDRQYYCTNCAQKLTKSVDGGNIYDESQYTYFVDGAGRSVCNVCRNEVDLV